MFQRLFGNTDDIQVQYLQWRVIVTLACLAVCLAALIFEFNAGPLFALVMLFVWGWGVVKSLFGVASVAAIFSGNVIFGVIIFLFYVIVAYLAGVFCAFLGVGRYIYLKVKAVKQRRNS